MTVRIALVGNCQVRTYKALLERAMHDVELRVMDFSDSYFQSDDNCLEFHDKCSNCDLIFVQNNNFLYTDPEFFRNRHGRQKVFAICNFFFRGLFPDLCHIGRSFERLGFLHYNSVLILGAFLKNMSVDDCLGLFTAETFARMGLFNAFDDSLRNLRTRDAEVDFPGTQLVQQLSLEVPIFRTFNHPTSLILSEYLFSILQTLDVPHVPVSLTLHEDPLYFVEVPIYDFVAEHYKAKYRTAQYWRYNTNDCMTQREFVERSYRAYGDVPRAALALNSPEDLQQEIRQFAPDWLQLDDFAEDIY